MQLGVAHLIRASLRYASRRYWLPLARDLRPVHTAADESAAAAALDSSAWVARRSTGWFRTWLRGDCRVAGGPA